MVRHKAPPSGGVRSLPRTKRKQRQNNKKHKNHYTDQWALLCVGQLGSDEVLDRSQQNYDRRSDQRTRSQLIVQQDHSHHDLNGKRKTLWEPMNLSFSSLKVLKWFLLSFSFSFQMGDRQPLSPIMIKWRWGLVCLRPHPHSILIGRRALFILIGGKTVRIHQNWNCFFSSQGIRLKSIIASGVEAMIDMRQSESAWTTPPLVTKYILSASQRPQK